MSVTTTALSPTQPRALVALGLALLLCFLVAAFGAQFRPGEWYDTLIRPSWTPPDAVFPPVWTTLYILMAVAAWLIWCHAPGRAAVFPLGLFTNQLILNGLWSWLFFGQHWIGVAMVEILVLWAAILATLVVFWQRRPLAGALLLPYLAWVSYAVALNVRIWQLNA